MTGIILIIIIMILLAVNGRRLQLEEKKRAEAFVRDSFGHPSSKKLPEERKKRLQVSLDDFLSGKNPGEYIDELTWSDTGMEDIFLQMDNCFSSAGEEYLYRQLHDLSLSKEDLLFNDSIINELNEDEDLREKLSLSLYRLGFVRQGSLPGNLKKILLQDHILNPFFHILCDIYYVIVAVLAFYYPLVAALFFVLILFVQISSYFSIRKKADEILSGFSMIFNMTKIGGMLPLKKDSQAGKVIEELSKDLKKIRLKTVFSAFLAGTGSGQSAGIFSLIFTYLNLLFHFDLIAAEFLLRKIGSQKDAIYSAYEKCGFLDMCLSVSSYRVFLEKKCAFTRPDFSFETGIVIKNGYNPLLNEPVPNDASNSEGILITGSNASGKSTYMRMIAVNAILAQTISTCPASFYGAPLFSIYSSIAVNDSILKGESYFMAEINSLKRIVDASVRDKRPVICFIDEIFKGTNTSERISAAMSVLKYLREKKVIVFAATHDLELTQLVAGCYKNVHFSEQIEGNDISFNYRLMEGPSKSRNAIALLKMKGFPENVILESEKMCSVLDDSDA